MGSGHMGPLWTDMTENIAFLQTTCAGGKSEDVHENHGENDGDGSRVNVSLSVFYRKRKSVLSRNWQYKDIKRKTTENQHQASILEANYYLSVYNIHLKLVSSIE